MPKLMNDDKRAPGGWSPLVTERGGDAAARCFLKLAGPERQRQVRDARVVEAVAAARRVPLRVQVEDRHQ
jgi:hypothetical protein